MERRNGIITFVEWLEIGYYDYFRKPPYGCCSLTVYILRVNILSSNRRQFSRELNIKHLFAQRKSLQAPTGNDDQYLPEVWIHTVKSCGQLCSGTLFSMGNKKSVFSGEQFETYQVCSSSIFQLLEKPCLYHLTARCHWACKMAFTMELRNCCTRQFDCKGRRLEPIEFLTLHGWPGLAI